MDPINLENAKKYVDFYEKNGRIPQTLKYSEESRLYSWRSVIMYFYDRDPSGVDPDVRDFLLSKIPNFFKHDFEIDQMEKAKEYFDFYKKNNRFPTGWDNEPLKLYHWSNIIKDLYVCSSNKLDPGVKEFLITKIPNFFKDPIEFEQTEKAKEYMEFYEKHKKTPRDICVHEERILCQWAGNIKNIYKDQPFKVNTEVKEMILSKFPLFFKEGFIYY